MKVYKYIIKRVIDIILSFIGIIFLAPVMVIIAVLIKIKIGSPIFFVQDRVGKGEKIFKLIKFRTMKVDNPSKSLRDENRLTKFGDKLRRLSIDELPELLNILKGDMSFIGPRPLLVEYLELYSTRERERHNVLPGLSGWAQINGRNSISWKEKFQHDIWYVDNMSFLNDLKIFLLTILKVLKKEGITQENSVTVEKYNGNN